MSGAEQIEPEPADAPETAAPPAPVEGEDDGPEETLAKKSVLGFILVPAILVLTVVGIIYLFYALTYQRLSVQDYVIKLKSQNKSERWQAALELVESNAAAPELVPILVEMLNSASESQEQNVAAWTSADMLKKPEERKVNLRWYAAAALAKIGGPQAYDALAGALADPDDGVRFYAAHGMGRMRDPRSVPALLGMLGSDKDPAVRMTCAWALGEIGDKQAEGALLAAHASDASQDVKWNSALALSRFCNATGRDTLKSMLDQPNPHTRDQARRALQLLDACEQK